MAKSERQPKVGDIVVYSSHEDDSDVRQNYQSVAAAIVSAVFPQEAEAPDTLVNIRVLPDGPKTLWRQSVKYSKDKEGHTWHWPED